MRIYILLFTIPLVFLSHAYSQNVSIPDVNLSAAVQEALGLSRNDPIPQKELEKLDRLVVMENNIKDITGLEKAIGLTHLRLDSNQISNITPLTNLTHLNKFIPFI